MAVLLHKWIIAHNQKNLSMSINALNQSVINFPNQIYRAKALPYVRPAGSFTVEAAFILPLFVFAAAVILGLFGLLTAELEVAKGLQYASRILASSCREEDGGEILSGTAGMLFSHYMKTYADHAESIEGGLAGISLADTELSGDYITLCADYRIRLPVSFWGICRLPVHQCVKSRKWIGAALRDSESTGDGYVYITPAGSAWHSRSSCGYLDLSVRSVGREQLDALRNRDGGIYYPCSCCKGGEVSVYLTDYGAQYHGSLTCSSLKRTVQKVRKEDVGGRHPCKKCAGGEQE